MSQNYKVLNSVAHNFGQGYVSTLNYRGDDYAMEHFLRYARETNTPVLEIDILKGISRQNVAPNSWVSSMITAMPKVFDRDVQSEGGSIQTVKDAKMTLSFDLNRHRPNSNFPALTEYPYTLAVTITDDRGIDHAQTLTGWWFEEPQRSKVERLTRFFKRLF
jgi:hypothetical protein